MADRSSESKAVHISQSAGGTLGRGSWRAEARVKPNPPPKGPNPNPLQIAAPPISGRLQVSASFLPCLGSGHHSTCRACLNRQPATACTPWPPGHHGVLVRCLLLAAENIRPLHRPAGDRDRIEKPAASSCNVPG